MRLVLLGVRGSTAAPGRAFVRYGGHTSCVAVLADHHDAPALVLDAGTGLRGLGDLLGDAPFQGALLLTHLHWDHVHGLPFCPALDHPDARVDLHIPVPDGGPSPRGLLSQVMSPPHFPIGPGGLRGTWRFLASTTASACVVAGFTVRRAEIAHKGGLTHGVRIDGDGVSAAYLPDHCPQVSSRAAEELAAGVDVLLHDGQFLPEEQATADAYGHATTSDALAFAERCGARRLVLIHHAPSRTDDELDALACRLAGAHGFDRPVEIAREGDVVQVARAAHQIRQVGPR